MTERLRPNKPEILPLFILMAAGALCLDNPRISNSSLRNHEARINSPNGKKGDIEFIPIAEVGAKDEFLNIKMLHAMTFWRHIECLHSFLG